MATRYAPRPTLELKGSVVMGKSRYEAEPERGEQEYGRAAELLRSGGQEQSRAGDRSCDRDVRRARDIRASRERARRESSRYAGFGRPSRREPHSRCGARSSPEPSQCTTARRRPERRRTGRRRTDCGTRAMSAAGEASNLNSSSCAGTSTDPSTAATGPRSILTRAKSKFQKTRAAQNQVATLASRTIPTSRTNLDERPCPNISPAGSLLVRIDGNNRAVVSILQFRHLDVAQVRLAARDLSVVVEEVPLALELDDGVMVGPAEHRLEDLAATVNGPYGDLPVAYMMKCVSPVEYEK